MSNQTGSSRDENIQGGAGDDSLQGGAGNDTLSGDNLIVNGTFEGDALESGYSGSTATGWTQLAGSEGAGIQLQSHTDGAAAFLNTSNVVGNFTTIQQDTGVAYNSAESYTLTMDVGSQFYSTAPVTASLYIDTGSGLVLLDEQTYQVNGWTSKVMVPDAIDFTVPPGASGATGTLVVQINVTATGSYAISQAQVDNVTLTTTDPAPIGGNDTIDGGAGDDVVDGGVGNDSIEGGDGADRLSGGGGDDTIDGGTGADTIYGESGDDLLRGGDDADNFTFEPGFGNDTVVGGQGGEDNDALGLLALTGGVTVTFTGDEAGTATDGTDTISFSEIEWIKSSVGDDVIDISGDSTGIEVSGRAGADSVTGGSGGDSVRGGGGDDILSGGDGADTLDGGADADQIDGGTGTDTLIGGTGDDTITTGAGDDLVILETSGGNDVITDFDLGDDNGDGATNDQLDLSTLTNADGNPVNIWDVSVTDDGFGNAVLSFPGGETVTLQGIAPAQMTGPQMAAMGITCFTAGTLILTPYGERPVEDLRVGDLVSTLSSGAQPIQWIASRCFTAMELNLRPEFKPIAIEPRWAGCSRRTLVSRQHGILVRLPGCAETRLARAVQLSKLKGGSVRIASGVRKVSYFHFMLPHHEVVFANGLATESFYPGMSAIETLAPHSQLSLLAQFPDHNLYDIAAAYGSPKVPYTKWRDLPKRLADVAPLTADQAVS